MLKEPKLPYDVKESPKNLGSSPIQSSKNVLIRISTPIVITATENTGSPTICLKTVLSIKRPTAPVSNIPINNDNQKLIPASVAKKHINPAPNAARAGCAKLKTSVALKIITNPKATKE